MLTKIRRTSAALLFAAASVSAQTAAETQSIVDRLDRLESENRRLSEEITALRSELARARAVQAVQSQTEASPNPLPAAVPQPPAAASHDVTGKTVDISTQDASLAERLGVQETRTAELDQKKVESSQKMPLQVTGMLLFNAFHNGEYSGSNLTDPVVASSTQGQRLSGATLRQTVLGLRFFGPQLPGGGTVSGSVYMDFSGGSLQPNNNLFRLRIATLDLAWKNTTISVGQDKPIIAPREPTSLAEVSVSPLTGAGNLWQWQPQARIEQRFALSDSSEIRAQAGVFESNEPANNVPAEYSTTVGVWRPAYEARVQYGYSHGTRRFEIAPGVHASSSRVAGQSVASRAVSLDWLVRPWSRVEFTGAWFAGKDLAGLGTLRQGFTVLPSDVAIPVHSEGGWSQLTITATSRWSFHLFGGVENDRGRDLIGNGISRNFAYGGNTMWK
ncbi:MAG TPA: hypothetical protein VG345_08560, partial [Bryobacteraceae bacterium]|nr:hypothetical protein [Bryobacteraceae bacterium]